MKYLNLLASFLIQLCLGGIYAWSAFVPRLTGSFDVSVAQTQLVFGISIATFTGAMLFAARLAERRGPRLVASIGGILFGLGYVTAFASQGRFPVLLLGIGILAGLGTGFGYACSLPTCMRWFPRHKGLVAGVVVAGFGGGAVVLTFLSEWLAGRGMGVLAVLGLIGVAYGSVILMAAQALRVPASQADCCPSPAPRLRALARDRYFLALVVGIFSGTFAGLMVIGNLKPLVLSAGAAPFQATWAISVFAVGNVLGRVAWGRVADRLGQRSIPASLAFLILSLILMGLATVVWPVAVVATALLVGFGFGACFVVYAAQTASRYGSDGFVTIYPLVFLAYGLAGIVGPLAGGWLYGVFGSYTIALWVAVATVTVGSMGCMRLLAGRATSEVSQDGEPRSQPRKVVPAPD